MEIEKLIEKITEEVYQKLSQEKNAAAGTSLTGSTQSVARMVDHTLLKPEATAAQIKQLCAEAKEYSFASVCVNPGYVTLAHQELRGSPVKVCTVIGFPLGATTTKTKVYETKEAIENGAQEVDMVVPVGAIKFGDWDYVKQDIESVVIAANGRALVKVIIETCLLSDEEKVRVCTLCKLVGANFVKTSTGFSTGGATVEDVALMRKVVGQEMGVKASGGIKDAATAQAMINAGASRLGTSSGIAIAKGKVGSSSY